MSWYFGYPTVWCFLIGDICCFIILYFFTLGFVFCRVFLLSVKYSAYSLCCLIVQDDFDGMYSCLFGIVCHLYCIGPSLACVLLGFACVFWYVLSFEVFSPQIAFPALSFASVFARCFCKCPVACAMVCHVLALATSLAVCVLSEAAGAGLV